MDRIGRFVYQPQPVRLPALVQGREAVRHRVAIVGGGPVGLGLALALARWGIASVVIESDTTVCEGSRAICISRRSLQILEQLGALPRFLQTGLGWQGGRSFYRDRQILHFTMPHDAAQKLPPMINLQQYYIEEFLVEAVRAQSALIDLRWGTELVGLDPQADGVALALRCSGVDHGLQADWVIACDGGQSLVRRSLGLKLEGTAFEGKYVIADIELASDYPTERRAWFDPPTNPGYTVLMHKQPDDIWRIDYQIPDDADLDAALRPERVEAFIRGHLAWIGEGHRPWRLVWTSAYRAGAMTLADYRHGRVLFAGNAAHAMPIFGVRGLNSGWDDAFNLGWKLALVLRGEAAEPLLDTYSEERLHGFHVNAASAIKSTEFMAPPSRGFVLMREAALSLAVEHPRIGALANPRQTHVIDYPTSSLNLPSDVFDAGPPPGSVFAESPLDGPQGAAHLSDALGPAFVALVFAPQGRLDPALDETLRALEASHPNWRTVVIARQGRPAGGDTRTTLLDRTGEAYVRYGFAHSESDSGVYLLRPDGHVAGRWRSAVATRLREGLRRVCFSH